MTALDHALQQRKPDCLRVLLRSIWKIPCFERRRNLARGLEPGKPHILEQLNEVYPAVLAEQILTIPLENYMPGSGPTLHRAPDCMLTADDRRLALMPSDYEKVGDTMWKEKVEKAHEQGGFEVIVKCKLVGLPELLEAPKPGRDLFSSLVQRGEPGIITADCMRATIAYKWQTYGYDFWIYDLLRYLVSCTCGITGLNILCREPPSCPLLWDGFECFEWWHYVTWHAALELPRPGAPLCRMRAVQRIAPARCLSH